MLVHYLSKLANSGMVSKFPSRSGAALYLKSSASYRLYRPRLVLQSLRHHLRPCTRAAFSAVWEQLVRYPLYLKPILQIRRCLPRQLSYGKDHRS